MAVENAVDNVNLTAIDSNRKTFNKLQADQVDARPPLGHGQNQLRGA